MKVNVNRKILWLISITLSTQFMHIIHCSEELGSGVKPPFQGYFSDRYDSKDMWMCRPDIEADACDYDLTATEILKNNELKIVEHQEAQNPLFDCFYIYPIVDLIGPVGNYTDFTDTAMILDPLLSQAARFTEVCKVYAPLYRQITFPTINHPDIETYLEIAYLDVEDAFKHYLGQFNEGRPFMLMGHSQGSVMTTMLIQRLIENDPEIKKQFIVGFIIGWPVYTTQDGDMGETFKTIPYCTSRTQTGCVISYRSYSENHPPTSGFELSEIAGILSEGFIVGEERCFNPSSNANENAYLSRSYFPLEVNQELFDPHIEFGPSINTTFVLYRNLYQSKCVIDVYGNNYLEISYAPPLDDQRKNKIPFDYPLFSNNMLGLHILDYNFAMGDLIELVDEKARVMLEAGIRKKMIGD